MDLRPNLQDVGKRKGPGNHSLQGHSCPWLLCRRGHEAVFVDEAGRVLVRPRVLKDLVRFARLWDRNLKAQGFVDAARAAARAAG